MVTARAANDIRIVGGFVVSTRQNARNASTAPKASAAFAEIAPLVTGRCAVRLTCLSNSRSATSLMQQPALRIRIVPSVNTARRWPAGKARAADPQRGQRRPQQQQPAGGAVPADQVEVERDAASGHGGIVARS